MKFAAVVGHRSGRATPSLRDAPQRQLMETVGREPSIGTETLFRPTRPPLKASFQWTAERGISER